MVLKDVLLGQSVRDFSTADRRKLKLKKDLSVEQGDRSSCLADQMELREKS